MPAESRLNVQELLCAGLDSILLHRDAGSNSPITKQQKACQAGPTLPSMVPLTKNFSSTGWKSSAVTKSVCLHSPAHP